MSDILTIRQVLSDAEQHLVKGKQGGCRPSLSPKETEYPPPFRYFKTLVSEDDMKISSDDIWDLRTIYWRTTGDMTAWDNIICIPISQMQAILYSTAQLLRCCESINHTQCHIFSSSSRLLESPFFNSSRKHPISRTWICYNRPDADEPANESLLQQTLKT